MEVENCRIAEMPDLKQENDWVPETLLEWIHNLIQKYDIDGIRIKTVIEVLKWFWDQFLNSAGVFQICVVFSGNPGYVAAYQRHLDSVFNYPLYYAIRNSFCGSFNNLKDYWLHNWNIFLAPEYLRVFVENHDNDRFLFRHKDVCQFTNAIIFSFLWEGISVVYYGGEQYFSGGYDLFNREPLWDG